MDCWKCGVYEQLLDSEISREFSSATLQREKYFNLQELIVSKIGKLMWLKDEDETFTVLPKLPDAHSPTESSGTETKRRERRAKANDGIVKGLYQDIISSKDEHMLIPPFCYGQHGLVESEEQPFKVLLHPQVPLICDVHAHVSEAEVIGFLAGKWDRENKALHIQAAIPCSSTHREDDDGATDVELDAEAEFSAREVIAELDLQVVGWYHSHPKFQADPSLIDVNNQRQYQSLMKDQETELEPFVGLIISTFDKQLPDGKSSHKWFTVKPYFDIYFPVQIEVEVMQFIVHPDASVLQSFQEENIFHLEKALSDWKKSKTVKFDGADIESLKDSALHPKSKEDRTETERITKEFFVRGEEISPEHEKSLELTSDGTDREGNTKENANNVSEEDEAEKVKRSKESAKSLQNSDHQENYFFEENEVGEDRMLTQELEEGITTQYVEETGNAEGDNKDSTNETEATLQSQIDKCEEGLYFTEAKEVVKIVSTVNDELSFEQEVNPVPKKRLTRGPKSKGSLNEEERSLKDKRASSRKSKPSSLYEDYHSKYISRLSTQGNSENQRIVRPKKRKLANEDGKSSDSISIQRKKKGVKSQEAAVPSENALPPSPKVETLIVRTIFDSFVLSVQDKSLQSSAIARKIIVQCPKYLRFVAVCLISVGFHFSRYSRRLELLHPWRGKIKLEKLAISANRWTEYFRTSEGLVNPLVGEFINILLDFYKSCWEEYSKRSGKVKIAR